MKVGSYKKMKVRMNSNRLVSVCAIIVSLGTLFLITYQTVLFRKEQHASVMPYLEIAGNISGNSGSANVFVTNKGLGPAKVEEIKVHYKDKTFQGDPYHFYKTIYPDSIRKLNLYIDKVRPGTMISKGEGIRMLGLYAPPQRREDFYNFFFREDVIVEIKYSFIYEETWVVRSDTHQPRKVD